MPFGPNLILAMKKRGIREYVREDTGGLGEGLGVWVGGVEIW